MRLDKIDPTELLERGDVEGFVAWHRAQPYHGMTMTGPDGQPAPGTGGAPPAQPAPGTAPPATGTPPAQGAPAGDGYVAQDEVTRIAAREKDQGKRAGQRALLEALGFDPETTKPEDVRAIIDAHRAREQATLTDQQRRDQELTQREQALAQREAAAQTAQHTARLTEVLLRSGVAGEVLPDARTLLASVPTDATDEALADEVGKLKTRLPALFAAQAPPPPPGGGFTGTPPRPQANGDAMARGAERAKALGLTAPATP